MTYHPLTRDTAQTPSERRAKADRIIKILHEVSSPDEWEPRHQSFVAEMDCGGEVSPKQLLFLRDLKDKYCS